MALFQKKPLAGSSMPLYTLGLNKTILLVGLGNPGKQYEGTRHNIGFACIDAFAAANDFPQWITKKDLKSEVTAANLGSSRVILMKPTTYMNLSGVAAQSVLHFYKVPFDQVVVIHDELDIPFGQIRLRLGGSSAGHNGIKSLIEHIGEGFGRVRIGIGNDAAKQMDGADFVLQKFSKDEQAQLSGLTREVSSILSEYVFGNGLPAETRSFLVD